MLVTPGELPYGRLDGEVTRRGHHALHPANGRTRLAVAPEVTVQLPAPHQLSAFVLDLSGVGWLELFASILQYFL